MDTHKRDYARVEKAIRYLGDHYRSQPTLGDVARHVGLSDFHFQRLFRRWAGVSPKRFVQHLTVQHAKVLLQSAHTTLDTSLETGLSSLGRLHDLFVAVEAMTPGQVKSGGAGLAVRYGVHDTPFGPCVLAQTGRGICALHFVACTSARSAQRLLAETWPHADLAADAKATAHTIEKIFGRRRDDRPLTLHLAGTNFQLQVWRALLHIPPGRVTCYGDVARELGRPTAVRAVAGAVAHNPVGYLIPCHRVLRATGEVGGYRWGIARKQAMLAREGA